MQERSKIKTKSNFVNRKPKDWVLFVKVQKKRFHVLLIVLPHSGFTLTLSSKNTAKPAAELYELDVVMQFALTLHGSPSTFFFLNYVTVQSAGGCFFHHSIN